ncbi:type I-U CRISPR-associated protein Cas5/Cas6 [bacterium]|nr:type I-U CRISPR-associated protein Cas5/Cas6 [bacterium]
MSIVIKARFPAGRYHATPWGRHVNEGVPEWPPSPWRLLRSLVAVWKRTLPELTEEQVRPVLEQLASPPVFRLPAHRVAHTRHYMPWEKKGPDDRTLVFDTFVSVDRNDELLMGWPDGELNAEQLAVLNLLVGNLTSLGRAESWVDAEATDSSRDHEDIDWNCRPSTTESNPVPVICPEPGTCFTGDHYPKHDAKKLEKGKVKPADFLFDCPPWHLCLDTETIHSNRWPIVPGSKWVNYEHSGEATDRPQRSSRRATQQTPTVAHFLIDGPVLPLVTDTLLVGEVFRQAAMSRFEWYCKQHKQIASEYRRSDNPTRYSSRVLSGKELNSTRLPGPGHAYYVPLPLESDFRRIGSVLVIARDGFNHEEVAALSGLSWLNIPTLNKESQNRSSREDTEAHQNSTHTNTKSKRKSDDLTVALIGLGSFLQRDLPLFGTSDKWISQTPFLGHKLIGLKGRTRYLRKGLRREWRRFAEQHQELQDVELIEIDLLNSDQIQELGLPEPFEFRRARRKDGGREAWRPAAMFRLKLSRPISGPLTLGYGCHFGLGQFIPDIQRS